jgi:hypothetical protein
MIRIDLMAAALLAFAAMPVLGHARAATGSAAESLAERVADRVAFTVVDELSPDEVAEDTTLFVNGQPVAHFRLSPEHRAAAVEAEIAPAPQYEYMLCGTATTEAQGVRQEHRVNDSGMIADPAGRQFSAYTRDYQAFFLVDTTPDRPQTSISIHAGPRCIGPVAAR